MRFNPGGSRITVRFLATCVAWCATLAPAAAVQWQDLTSDDARAIVTAFAGEPVEFADVQLKTRSLEPPDWFVNSAEYYLSTADGSAIYVVSRWWEHNFLFSDRLYDYAWVGGAPLEDWDDFYGQNYSREQLLALQMPIEDAQPTATTFAQAHYPDFGLLNNLYSAPSVTTSWGFVPAYSFVFYQKTETGASTPNLCLVRVDSVLGKVVKYVQHYFPIEIATTASVTADEAGEIALSALMEPGGTVESVEGPSVLSPDALGLERLVWLPTVEGYEALTDDHSWTYYIAYVDAQTGELLSYYEGLGMKPRPLRDAPIVGRRRRGNAAKVAVLRQESVCVANEVDLNGRSARLAYRVTSHGAPFMYVRYLAAFGAVSFAYEKRCLTIRMSRGLVRARVGERSVLNGGQRTTYGVAPINVRGRIYLPLPMFRDIADADVAYDAVAKRIRISGVRRAPFHVEAKPRP